VQRLEIQLVVGLDRHEAHPWPTHCLGNRLSIDIVTLVRLHVRLYILRWDQPNFMPLFSQCAAEKMGTTAGFHADQLDLPVRRETQQLQSRELLAHQNFAAQVETNQMKHCLAKVDADRV